MTAARYWPVNWRVALENALDSHVMYVHRNALLQLVEPILQFGPSGYRPRIVNGRAALGYIPDDEAPRQAREYYPGVDGHWPKTQWRRLWLWAFRWRLSRRITRRPFNPDEEWGMHTFLDGKRVRSGGHHLPSMFRFDFGTVALEVCEDMWSPDGPMRRQRSRAWFLPGQTTGYEFIYPKKPA